ncbi:MAG: DUF87 domain-containing protein [Planctomycetes bacterium]|nr:DUF87 domain-containing protein [Planctomycetota bacterium]MBI3844956.1 DUF87 domain-containing protein [Planctomycetota bacterium]
MANATGGLYVGTLTDATRARVLIEPRDLTSHAVCFGMTGSGKTGLCLVLLEEIARAGVPAILIDPKGDIGNLFLAFPELRPQDFEPWVNPDDARREGLEVGAFAAKKASEWQAGLRECGLGPGDVRAMRDAVDFAVFTPGSESATPVDVIGALRAPAGGDIEARRDLVSGTASGLLALVGIDADPIRSREHILLANLLDHAWSAGRDLDLPSLINGVIRPPMDRLGVFPVDTFFPEKDRMSLAMALNGVLAAPGFAAWLRGVPLDPAAFLKSARGKPQVSLFSIAHLSDAERMFFVTILLQRVVAWMRRQPGTTELRALVYFDETFGYLPPHPADPPSKAPILTLLKQARAFGVGALLATQNPVDLDYKALTNAGTWFLGRLQTERDKDRVLEGLRTASAIADPANLSGTISSLPPRTFVLHRAKSDRPVVFKSRFAMSYLRGPLTQAELGKLQGSVAMPATSPPSPTTVAPTTPADVEPAGFSAVVPPVPAGFVSRHLSRRATFGPELRRRFETAFRPRSGDRVLYVPALYGVARVLYDEESMDLVFEETVDKLVFPATEDLPKWDAGTAGIQDGDLLSSAEGEARYAPLPRRLQTVKAVTELQRDFVDFLFRTRTLKTWVNRGLKLTSRLDETEETFRTRCQEAAHAKTADEAAALRDRYERDADRLKRKIEKEAADLDRAEADRSARKREELLSAGETIFGFLLGRRSSRALSQAATKRRMTERAGDKAVEAKSEIEALKAGLTNLSEKLEDEVHAIESRWLAEAAKVQPFEVRLEKNDIRVTSFGVLWIPVTAWA